MVPVAVINEISSSAAPVDLTVRNFMEAHSTFVHEQRAIQERAEHELSDLTTRHKALLAPVMQEFFDESCSLRRGSSTIKGNDDQVLVHHFGDLLASHERLFSYKGFLNRLAQESAEAGEAFPVLLSYVSSEGRGAVQSLCMYVPGQSQLVSEVTPVENKGDARSDQSRCRLALDCRTVHVQGLERDNSASAGFFKVREIRSMLVMSEYREHSTRDIGSPVIESLDRLLDSEHLNGVAVTPRCWIGWKELDSFMQGAGSSSIERVTKNLLQGFYSLGVHQFSTDATSVEERLNSAARHLEEHYRMARYMDA